ncbi:MAG: hypothetical protein OEW86_11415 [Nitrosopumilus sp.]|nr:hypothetical protein [Nitrosopumilus sp.]
MRSLPLEKKSKRVLATVKNFKLNSTISVLSSVIHCDSIIDEFVFGCITLDNDISNITLKTPYDLGRTIVTRYYS